MKAGSRVLDASFFAAAVFESDLEVYRQLNEAANFVLKVPDLFWYEIGNIMIKKTKNGQQLDKMVVLADETVKELAIVTEHIDQKEWLELTKLAKKYDLTYYDASYLYVAIQNQCKLLTLDSRLINAYNKCIC